MRILPRSATPIAAPTSWFTGDAWIESIATPDRRSRTQIDSVRFAPGSRTVWHRHPLGQTLVVTEGTGLVQSRGGEVRIIRTGDTVRIAAGEWHWHGATATSGMTHLAIEEISTDDTATDAGDPVTDAEYPTAENTDVPPITRTTVLDQRLPAPLPTERVEIRRITVAPGFAAGPHVHNGPVFGSIETGSVVYQIEGAPESVLGAGDTFYEPEGARIARFDAQDDGVTFLGYFLLAADQQAELTFLDT